MPRATLPPQITLTEASAICGLSTRRLRSLSATPPLCYARSKGEGRNARVTLDRKAFAEWMEARRSVRAGVSA